MEKFAFFPSENGDRKVKSAELAAFLSQLFTNGVFNNGCKVEKGDGMSVVVKPGFAFINGEFYLNDSDLRIPISTPNAAMNRIDNIVIRLTNSTRDIHAIVVEGVPNSSASAPELVRTDDIHDIRIATVVVNKGTSSIETSMITDCRFDSTDCGMVMGAVKQIDTTEVFNQYKAYFEEWFKNIKTQLSGDVAANLQNEIDTILEQLKPYDDNFVAYGTCSEEELQRAIEASD